MDTFQSTVIMSPYLLAFVVGEFDDTMNAEESNFKIWHEPSMKEQAKFAASIAPSALHFYEEYFKVDYPLTTILHELSLNNSLEMSHNENTHYPVTLS